MKNATETVSGKSLRWILILGIIIVANLFLAQVIQVAYAEPKYEAFCTNLLYPNVNEKGVVDPEVERVYNQSQTDCSNRYQAAQNIYKRNVFIVYLVVSALCIVYALQFAKNTTISHALGGTGILAILTGSLMYWSEMGEIIRLLLLLVLLVFLFWVGYHKFTDSDSK